MIWGAVAVSLVVPFTIAGFSPLLAWRQPVYIIAGFAGIVGLGLMLLQPMLAAGLLPGLKGFAGRRVHRWTGTALVAAVLVHVGGLWITSPPDVIDALTFTSPTPFAPWGVIAMWAVFGAAALALMRRRLRLMTWRRGHTALISLAVLGTIIHVVLIEGTMGQVSKVLLCVVVGLALMAALLRLKPWTTGPSANR